MQHVTLESHIADAGDGAVFRALADSTRRAILDRLFERDGQTLGEIERAFGMSRFGVMKHLRVLEDAGLVTSQRTGRSKLHYLNPVPIRELHDRWTHKFTAAASAALLGFRADIEKGASMAPTEPAPLSETRGTEARKPSHVFAIFIRASREQIWEALTSSESTLKYYYASTVESDWRPGSSFVYRIDGKPAIVGDVVESTPPEKLVCTFDARWDDDVRGDPPSRITWLLEEAGPRVSKVTVVHDGFESETATFAQIGGGMPFILSGLKTLLETGEPLLQG